MSAIKVNPITTVSASSIPSKIKPVIPQMKPDTYYEKELCQSVKKKQVWIASGYCCLIGL